MFTVVVRPGHAGVLLCVLQRVLQCVAVWLCVLQS